MAVLVKTPDNIDVDVGTKIKLRRRLVGMSQESLGAAIGVTFQQVQKYEKGMNRVGASRLARIAEVLGVPVSFFFSGAGDSAAAIASWTADREITDFISSPEGLALNKAFAKIENLAVKRKVVALVKTLSFDNEQLARAEH
ncbi:helix-turn-helix transcriptional regulator (plasmid) [Agrobacterium leguminum]|uniref:helix-turn-helix domain-containing protein n=1 Tax=Agrobacterium leguminum TaxID=2792015 RepID=UPI0010CA1876|nr:helix-turn-helix transcriptional regulator [Agrobacterium leguminum]WFS69566.1 helix-turn-helix transcriptional regulator [Agrobacterium leguminum]